MPLISGTVNANNEARVRLWLQNTQGDKHEIDAVIDTGFNGFLTLPPALMTRLGCPHIGRGRAVLANGQLDVFDVYEATIIWDGQPRAIEVDAADTDPLIGMSLLHGLELRIQAIEGGQVTIEPIL